MKTKINYKKAAETLICVAEKYNGKIIDIWDRKKAGMVITYTFATMHYNIFDLSGIFATYIATAKNKGYINDGIIRSNNNEITVKIF